MKHINLPLFFLYFCEKLILFGVNPMDEGNQQAGGKRAKKSKRHSDLTEEPSSPPGLNSMMTMERQGTQIEIKARSRPSKGVDGTPKNSHINSKQLK